MTGKWWQNKIVYQIYPKSFLDTDGDGFGDLRGIISRLDYLKDLGADILWLCPIYPSPLVDGGYDISDYYGIDPRYGTMDDMDELIAEAKKRDMYILMDLVVNHCSDQHEWFKKACEDPDGKYGHFFYLRNQSEGLPTNWRGHFGSRVWDPLPGTDRQYLHLFAKEQPDLNWENPELREEIYKMINWWLDKGLAGFRIDAIVNIKKPPFVNYEADRKDGLCSIHVPFAHADTEGLGAFLAEMKEKTFAPHDAFTVAEVAGEYEGLLSDFVGEDGYFSSIFDFRASIFGKSDKGWYDWAEITPDDFRNCCFESQRIIGTDGFYANILENHDQPRGVSRFIPGEDLCDTSKKMLAALYFMLRGIPFIYQGQEIGMENAAIDSMDRVNDVDSIDQYQVALNAGCTQEEALAAVQRLSRDNGRTPMQWNDGQNAGFTRGTPWMDVNRNCKTINVRAQEKDPDSVLNFYKKLIALRKDPDYQETLVYGTLEPIWEDRHSLMAYTRTGDRTLLVVGNYQKKAQSIEPDAPVKKILINNYPDVDTEGNSITLKSYQVLILEL